MTLHAVARSLRALGVIALLAVSPVGGCVAIFVPLSYVAMNWDEWYPPDPPMGRPVGPIMREVITDFTAKCERHEGGYYLPDWRTQDCAMIHEKLARCSLLGTSDEIGPCKRKIMREASSAWRP